MTVSDSHIAEVRKAAALVKFRHKVTVLEGLVGKPLPSSAPTSLKVRPFIRWKAPELGVKNISPALFYSKLDEHTELRNRAVKALTELSKACARPKAAPSELASVKLELKQSRHGQRVTETELVKVRAKLDQLTFDLEIMKQRVKRKHTSFNPANVLTFPRRPGGASSV